MQFAVFFLLTNIDKLLLNIIIIKFLRLGDANNRLSCYHITGSLKVFIQSSIYWHRNTFFQTPHKASSQDASKLMFNRTISVCDLLSWKKETVQYVACIGHVETIMYWVSPLSNRTNPISNYVNKRRINKLSKIYKSFLSPNTRHAVLFLPWYLYLQTISCTI